MWYKVRSRMVVALTEPGIAGRSLSVALLLVLAVLLFSCQGGGERRPPEFGGFELADSPWPKVNADLRNTRHVEGTPITNPTIAWQREIEGKVAFEPVIAGDKLIVVTWNPFKLIALNLSDGTIAWEREERIISNPLVTNKGIVTISEIYPMSILSLLSYAGDRIDSIHIPARFHRPQLTLINGYITFIDNNYMGLVAIDKGAMLLRLKTNYNISVNPTIITTDSNQVIYYDSSLRLSLLDIDTNINILTGKLTFSKLISINECSQLLVQDTNANVIFINLFDITNTVRYELTNTLISPFTVMECKFIFTSSPNIYIVDSSRINSIRVIDNNELIINDFSISILSLSSNQVVISTYDHDSNYSVEFISLDTQKSGSESEYKLLNKNKLTIHNIDSFPDVNYLISSSNGIITVVGESSRSTLALITSQEDGNLQGSRR